jgi:hypothetical protein
MKRLLDKLRELKKEQILDIVLKMMEQDEVFKIKLQKYVDSKFHQLARKNEIDDDNGKYHELWDEAEGIIDDLNDYGGGSEEDEITAYDNLQGIVELFKKGNLDVSLRREFIKNCVHFYQLGNSGMGDNLIDASFDVCENKDDWLFLIDNLKEIDENYTNHLIMEIYKEHLKDDETYLQLRMDNLHYGTDYYDLVKYYDARGDKQKAIKTALEGLKNGTGRIIDLITYLQKYYKNKKDHVNSLKYHLLAFRENPSLDSYKEIKIFCTSDEWKAISKELYVYVLGNECVKRHIDFENKEYKKVFESITKTKYCFDTEWAKKLEPFFPEALIKIYKQRIEQNIAYKQVGAYSTATSYCIGVKRILENILNKKEEWRRYIESLKERYPKLPALQRELKKL